MPRQWTAKPGGKAAKQSMLVGHVPIYPFLSHVPVFPSATVHLDVTTWPDEVTKMVSVADTQAGRKNSVVLTARRPVVDADFSKIENLAVELDRSVRLVERKA